MLTSFQSKVVSRIVFGNNPILRPDKLFLTTLNNSDGTNSSIHHFNTKTIFWESFFKSIA